MDVRRLSSRGSKGSPAQVVPSLILRILSSIAAVPSPQGHARGYGAGLAEKAKAPVGQDGSGQVSGSWLPPMAI